MSKLGYDVHSFNYDWTHFDRLKPRVMLIMNGWSAAADFKRRYPSCAVIHRVTEGEESSMHLTPGKTLAHLKRRAAEIQHSGVYINLGCEPDISDDSKLKKLNDEYLIALQWAVANNIRVAAPHFAHYRLEGTTWHIVDSLMDFIADSPLVSDGLPLLIATFDEYGAFIMHSGAQDTRWPGSNEEKHLPVEHWLASNVPKYYHHGRKNDYLRDRKTRGKKIPYFADTELGCDRLEDVGAWLNTLPRNNQWPNQPNGRGWQTLIPAYEQYYGQATPHKWSPARAYAKTLVAACNTTDSEFGDKYLGGMIFCRGSNGDTQWDSFRTDGQPDFENELETAQAGESTVTNPPLPPVPKPSDAGLPVLARMLLDYNLRPGPGTAYTPAIRVVPKNEVVQYYPNEITKTVANGYTWVYVETLDSDGEIAQGGFMALESQFLRLIPVDWPKLDSSFLPVPFQTQRGTGSNNCGPAALTSILHHIGKVANRPELEALTIQDVILQTGNAGNFTSFQQLINAAGHWGVMAFARTNQSLATLRNELNAERPFIALIERGKIPGTQAIYPFTGAHFVPVIGYDNTYINILDPLALADTQGGDLLTYPAEFNEAWRATTGNAANFQAMLFDESAFVPATPTDDGVCFTEAELQSLKLLHTKVADESTAMQTHLTQAAQNAGAIAAANQDIAAIYDAALGRDGG